MPPVPARVSEKNIENSSASNEPDRLRPYAHHGVDLTPRGSHAVGTCPFCGKDGKFSVDTDYGLWRCFVCGGGTDSGGGNALTFLRLLWERSDAATNGQGKAIAQDRGLLDPATVTAWGVCVSIIDRSWLVPGYDITGKLVQVYRRGRVLEKGEWVWRLLPTPGVWPDGKVHAIHMPSLTFDPAKPRVDVFEGPWDGMAFWETARQTKSTQGMYDLTGSEASSIIADSNVIAVPGCNTFPDHWLPMFRGKDVTVWFDSDHPRVVAGKTYRAGFDGVFRVAKKLSGIAASVTWCRWGKEGFDPDKPSGYDVRDELRSYDNRRDGIAALYARVEPVPAEWFNPTTKINGHSHSNNGKPDIEVQRCDNWHDLEGRWTEALEWRGVLSDGLTVLLAVCASTNQGGNQLFLDLIGDPGSAKTTLCEGLLVSSHCHHLEHLTGFHSGFKLPGNSDKDCSLIARINGKTLVTCEADVMISNPRFQEIMAQQRRIFDGKSGASYKNTDVDILYEGLRTPWIKAGTKKLLSCDQSQLGDRFMRFMIDSPDEALKDRILSAAFDSEMEAIIETTNGTSASITEPRLRKAQALTGGYVDWLRANVEERVPMIDVQPSVKAKIIDLAKLTADLRARPDMSFKRPVDQHDSKELPTRVTRQLARLAKCAAVVLNKREVDGDVMRIVRKVALDTAYGHTLSFVTYLTSYNPKKHGCTYQQTGGLGPNILALWTGLSEERLKTYLDFLRKIGVATYKPVVQSTGFWSLTERVYNLYLKVMED